LSFDVDVPTNELLSDDCAVSDIITRSDVSCQTSLATVPCINTSDSLRKIQVSRHSLDLSNENINRVRDTHDKWSDDVSIKTTDLWSAALREAINTYEPKLDIARFDGKTIAQLFTDLDTIDKSCTEQSIFRRGLAHLQSVRGPLDNFKVALDLVHPFLSFDPTAATAVGIVKGVTAVRQICDLTPQFAAGFKEEIRLLTCPHQIAISLASADLEFARIVGDMLEQISYIDDCDTLGQKTDSERIHNVCFERLVVNLLTLGRHSFWCTRKFWNFTRLRLKLYLIRDPKWFFG
jgi:hypothetical protein